MDLSSTEQREVLRGMDFNMKGVRSELCFKKITKMVIFTEQVKSKKNAMKSFMGQWEKTGRTGLIPRDKAG